MSTYLDLWELAERLELQPGTIMHRLRKCPWNVPPRAQVTEEELLRWKTTEVELWLREQQLLTGKAAVSCRARK